MSNKFDKKELFGEKIEIVRELKLHENLRTILMGKHTTINDLSNQLDNIYTLFYTDIKYSFQNQIERTNGRIIAIYLINYFKQLFIDIVVNKSIKATTKQQLTNIVNKIRYIHSIVLMIIIDDPLLSLTHNIKKHYTLVVIAVVFTLINNVHTNILEHKGPAKITSYSFMWDYQSIILDYDEMKIIKNLLSGMHVLFPDIGEEPDTTYLRESEFNKKACKIDKDKWELFFKNYNPAFLNGVKPNNISNIHCEKASVTSYSMYDVNFNENVNNGGFAAYVMNRINQTENYMKQFMLIFASLFSNDVTSDIANSVFTITSIGGNLYIPVYFNSKLMRSGDSVYGNDKFYLPWDLLKNRRYDIINNYKYKWTTNTLYYLKHQYHSDEAEDNSIVIAKDGSVNKLLPSNIDYINMSKNLAKTKLNENMLSNLRTDFIILIAIIKYHFGKSNDMGMIINIIEKRKDTEDCKFLCNFLLLCLKNNDSDFNKLYIQLEQYIEEKYNIVGNIYGEHTRDEKYIISRYLMFLFMYRRFGTYDKWNFNGTNIDNVKIFRKAKQEIFKDMIYADQPNPDPHFPAVFKFHKSGNDAKEYTAVTTNFMGVPAFVYTADADTYEVKLYKHIEKFPDEFTYSINNKFINVGDYTLTKEPYDVSIQKFIDKINNITDNNDVMVLDKKVEQIIRFTNYDLDIVYKNNNFYYENYIIQFDPINNILIDRWYNEPTNVFLLEKIKSNVTTGEYSLLVLEITNNSLIKKSFGKIDDLAKEYGFTTTTPVGMPIIDSGRVEESIKFNYYKGKIPNEKKGEQIYPKINRKKKYHVLNLDKIGLNINGKIEGMVAYFFTCVISKQYFILDILINYIHVAGLIKNGLEIILPIDDSDKKNLRESLKNKFNAKLSALDDLMINSHPVILSNVLDADLKLNDDHPSIVLETLFTKEKINGLGYDFGKCVLSTTQNLALYIATYKDKIDVLMNLLNNQYNQYIFANDPNYVDWLLNNNVTPLIYQIIYLKNCLENFKKLNKGDYKCNQLMEYNKYISLKQISLKKRYNYVVLFEFLFSNIVGKEQYDIIYDDIVKDMEGITEKKIFQFLMGKGKTSVITPLLTFHHIFMDKYEHALLLMPSHLLSQSYDIFFKYSLLFGNMELQRYKMKRHKFISDADLARKGEYTPITYSWQKKTTAIKKIPNSISLMDGESIQVHLLNEVELSKQSNKDKYGYKRGNYYNMKDNVFSIMDEIDSLANPQTSEVNHPSGGKYTINEIYIQFLVDLLLGTPKNMSFDERNASETYVTQILKKIEGQNYFDSKIWNMFLSINEVGVDQKYSGSLPNNANEIKQLAILRKIRSALIDCFTMAYRKDYGLGDRVEGIKKNEYIAIPYSAVDQPVNGSEFTDIFLTVILTILSYVNKGLTKENILILYNDYYKKISENYRIYTEYIEKLNIPIIANSAKDRTTLFPNALTTAHIELINQNLDCTKDFMLAYIFNEKNEFIESSTYQQNSSFVDIMSAKRIPTRTAFSGTIKMLLAKLPGDNANIFLGRKDDADNEIAYTTISSHKCHEVLNTVKYKRINEFRSFKKDEGDINAESHVRFAVEYHFGPSGNHAENKVMPINSKIDMKSINNFIDRLNDYHALIDTGAFLKDIDLMSVVNKISTKFDKHVVYIKNGKKRKYYDGTDSDFDKPINDMFIYYDHKHTVGQDVKQNDEMKGLVTIAPFNSLTHIAQGMFRLRKLNRGHKVDFLISDKLIGINNSRALYTHLVGKDNEHLNVTRTRFKIQNIKTNIRLLMQNEGKGEDHYNSFGIDTFIVENEIKYVNQLKQLETKLYWDFLKQKICSNNKILIKYLCVYLCYYIDKHGASTKDSKSKSKEVEREIEVLKEKVNVLPMEVPVINIEIKEDIKKQDYKNLNKFLNYITTQKMQKYNNVLDYLKNNDIYISPGWLVSRSSFDKKQRDSLNNSVMLEKNGIYIICTNNERFILTEYNYNEIYPFTKNINLQIMLCKFLTFSIRSVQDVFCLASYLQNYGKAEFDQLYNFIKDVYEIDSDFIAPFFPKYLPKISESKADEVFNRNVARLLKINNLPINLSNIVDEEIKKVMKYLEFATNYNNNNTCLFSIDNTISTMFNDELKDFGYLAFVDNLGNIGATNTNKTITHNGKTYNIYKATDENINKYPELSTKMYSRYVKI